MQFLEIREDVGSVGGDVGDGVHAADDAIAVDQERMPSREVRVLVVGATDDVIHGADAAVGVAQQGEVELLVLSELEVLGGRVERCAEDGAVGFGEEVGAVTQRLSFECSTRCRRFGVPPQEHPPTAIEGEAHLVAVLVGEAEVGCMGSGNEHVVTLRDTGQNPNQPLCVSFSAELSEMD